MKKEQSGFIKPFFLIVTVLIMVSIFYLHSDQAPTKDSNINFKNGLEAEIFQLATTTPEGKPYQYVNFAFDGSRSIGDWKKTLDFAKSMKNAGTEIHFTYFINAIYLVPEIHKDIYVPHMTSRRVYKGTSLLDDGYSSFEGKTRDNRTLDELLKANDVEKVYVCGLATDYCVRKTVLDARKLGYETIVISDAIDAVDPITGKEAIEEMKAAGAIFKTTKEVINE